MADSPADRSALDPDSIGHRDFTTTFRGFDQVEVRGFLNKIGAELKAALAREAELSRRLDEAERRAGAAEEPDEHRLTAMLGEETARILDAARDAANEIRAKAESKTAQLVREAQDDANRMTSEAAEVLRLRTTEAESDAATVRGAAEADRDRLLGDATAEAERLVSEATTEAERMVSEATAEAERLVSTATTEAERSATNAEISAERVTAEAGAEAERLTTEATTLRDEAATAAAEAVEAGRVQGRDMVAEAQVVRERILTDLARRRKAARVQLEQLRAARERLLEAYAVVRRTVDEATTELAVAVPEARLAAESAGRRVELDDDMSVDDIEAELDTGRFAGLPLLDVGDDAAPEDEDEDEVEDAIDDDEPAVEEDIADTSLGDTTLAEDVLDDAAAEAGEGGPVSDIFSRLRSGVPVDTAPEPDVEPDAADSDADLDQDDDDEDREETVLERRDRYTVVLERDLGRALKRRLADDENDKLDLIRRRSPKDGAEVVVGDLALHREGFVDAVRDQLRAAGLAGTQFAAEVLSDQDQEPAAVDSVGIDDLAAELAESLVDPIRAKTVELLDGSEGDDALDGVRACYRQWKGRAGELAAQYVHTAFNRGVFAAVPEGTMVSWVVDDGADPCPDGEDDALGGAVVRGEGFPTGHLHPPAHPACRCLLVPGVL